MQGNDKSIAEGRQPRPGHMFLTGSGMEVYDVTAHIQRAFEGRGIGEALTVSEVCERGRRAGIPESFKTGGATIGVRIKALVEGRSPIKGLGGNYDSVGRPVAYLIDPPTSDNLAEAIKAAVFSREYQEPITILPLARITGYEPDALAARVQAMLQHRVNIPGVMASMDHLGRKCVWRSVPLPGHSVNPFGVEVRDEVKVALNDPTVQCCGRDAADCDCHPLTVMYVEARKVHGPADNNVEEMARETAIALIVTAGFDANTPDSLGEAVGGSVQSLLMTAFMRSPSIGEMLFDQFVNEYAPKSEAQVEAERNEIFANLAPGNKYQIKFMERGQTHPTVITAYFKNEVESTSTYIFQVSGLASTYFLTKNSILDIAYAL